MSGCKDFLCQDIVSSVQYALEAGYRPGEVLSALTELFTEEIVPMLTK